MRIDLHMHSTVSDGTDASEALLSRVRAAGLDLFSLTDHDAIQGCGRILAARKPEDPAFLPGVEFPCKDEEAPAELLRFLRDVRCGS